MAAPQSLSKRERRRLGRTASIYFAVIGVALLVATNLDSALFRGVILGVIAVAFPSAFILLTLARRAMNAAADLAYRDDLTGLVNRRFFMERTAALLEEAEPGSVAIVLLDIEGLKQVNDACGQQAGDELICLAANYAAEAADDLGEVCRVGGGEIAVVIHQEDRSLVFNVLRAMEPFTALFQTCGHSHVVEIAAGFASSDEGESLESLLRRASKRLNDSKRRLHGSESQRTSRPPLRVVKA